MARRSQCSSAGDNPLDPNYLPPHYREEYRLAIDELIEEDLEGYYRFLQRVDVVDFLSTPEIQYIQNSIQVPQQSHHHPEQRSLELGGDGSSDTYWPIHSDLDVPGLDLGWPQLHHFIGPTEVTTLVNPPEPDMPSIKEQARRLIKNAQQVIAVVMDMFTDVDMFADILNAAARSVAVYILLDEQNAHHFVNMVSNCRVDLQSIQFLRVRTVSGITYHCRSGKSFKGQMMDRFLLTDCRAVLSGNYSFMWSFEKLHRSMAHLFLGQLVSTFDEEFRILFAQSQPLMIENVLAPMEDLSLLSKRQYPSERTSLFREPRKFLSMDTGHPEDVDWRMMPLKKQGSLHGPADMYGRFPPQQSRMDLSFEQGPSRMLENPAFKRHSYAEGVHGRFSYPFLQQQGMPEPENQGPQFHRGQQPYPGPGLGPEAEYSGYDRFWNQGYHSADPYSEPGLPQDMQPPENFDHVYNYLSSTRNVDFDQSSEKVPPAADLPFSSSHPRRLSLGHTYACQTSPTPSNPTDQKQFFQEPHADRKDPTVKRGLRNWRISSFLSAHDNPGDEGLPLVTPQAPDAFEEPLNPIPQTAPGIDLTYPKIPNVREFKVPAIPRASQIPGYIKATVREQPKKLPDEPPAVTTETKTTPTPSESSSTAEGEKAEEAEEKEPKEPKTSVLRREESFRRNYNPAAPRSSRLRSSLIFSSLEQQHGSQDSKTALGQQDEESDRNEAEQTKLPFVSQVLGQRRSAAREPFEWGRYMKSASATDVYKPDDGDSKADDKDLSKEENSKDLSENREGKESLKPPDVEQNLSPSVPISKPPDQPVQPPKPLLTTSYDMNDPDKRLMFFKELAAKRKAAKAAEAEKSKDKAPLKPPTDLKNTTAKKEEPEGKEENESVPKAVAEESEVPGSSKDVKADSTPPSPSPSSPKSGLPNVSNLESSTSKPDQIETIILQPQPEHTQSETCSPVNPDITSNASQSSTSASPQDAPTQATPPPELNLTTSVTPTPVETVSCSPPLTESVGSVLPPEAEKTEGDTLTLCSTSDPTPPPEEITTDSNKTPTLPSTETSSPTEPTSKIPTEPEAIPESVTSESLPSEPPVPAENSKVDHQSDVIKEPELPNSGEKKSDDTEATNKVKKSAAQESVTNEKTNDQVRQNNCTQPAEVVSDEVVPLSPQTKQPKSGPSRYHSSTVNVLSCSNLRDDTKLLLEQISANSQSRNEATKESPVTDDEKEDEADKNAKREKERGLKTFGRGLPKSTQEREKLLERIQSMRKERKVYSRFEMAP
ncbi:protein FAM83H-like protein [Lates japonicus]|uniref:Protein FAM83H-like protein n=1 Tax=Lates japonicus TaxID=270547 RepID=A0AAD3MLW9_LATJO|nr:protein FAM83H-like protein [Lates japonicus]